MSSNQYSEMYFHFHFGKLVPINIWKWKSISNVAYINILPTFLKNCNDSKEQGRMMIFYHPRDGDLPRDGECPWDGEHYRYDGQ